MRGPMLLMGSIALFGVLDANSKALAAEFSAAQAIFLRHAVILALLFMARALWREAGGSFATAHPVLHLLRGAGMLAAGLLFYIAFRNLPLADGYLVFFAAPFVTLALSGVVLKEAVPRTAWLWSVVGFGGVLLALSPRLGEGGASLFGFGCAATGTLCYAGVTLVNRRLRDETGVARLLLWPSALGLLVTAPPAAWHWVPPDAAEWAGLLANGVVAGLATVMLALAFRHATLARLAPFEFVALPWSVALGWALFGEVPGWPVLAGGAVVALACWQSELARRERA